MVPDGEFYLVRNAGHFLQEDAGEEVADRIIRFLATKGSDERNKQTRRNAEDRPVVDVNRPI